MIFVMVLFVLLSIVRACGVNIPGFLTMIVEAVLLLIFGFCLAGEGQTV